MRSAGCRAVVLEVSSQALYLDRVYGIPFDAVAFTNLAPDHIGGFEHPTFEHYRDSKKKLFTDFGATFARSATPTIPRPPICSTAAARFAAASA